MIHPEACCDPFLAPLHRTFLIGCFVVGAAALVVLPLHLALAGAPQVATLLALAWMLCQWPLALYVSQSGALNRAIGFSAGLFALFIAAICMVTGGTNSFALLWLLVPPMEAAFSTSRRIVVFVTAFCAGLLAAVTFLPVPAGVEPVPAAGFVATLAAITYVGMLAMRISLDRRRAQAIVLATETRRQLMSQSIADAYFELGSNGALRLMGGPLKQLLGHVPTESGDWLFARLHVADRPIYLTHLAEIRSNGLAQSFEVRLRVGASQPGEAGQAEYRHFTVILRSFADEAGAPDDEKVLLTLRATEPAALSAAADAEKTGGRVDRLARSLLEEAGSGAREALSEILQQTGKLRDESRPDAGRGESNAANAIAQSGARGLAVLETALDLVPGRQLERMPEIVTFDLADCLEDCAGLVAPAAARRRVAVEVVAGVGLPATAADRRLLRQAICFVLADMIETSDAGALLTVSTKPAGSRLGCVLSVKNRQSGLSWSSEASGSVLGLAQALLERTGGGLSVETVLGQGECVHIHLPLQAEHGPVPRDRSQAASPLAKSA
ncbi:ATP-binding protein [Roseibium sp. M-1]